MVESLSQWIMQRSTTRAAVLCLFVFLAFMAGVLPGQAQQAELRSSGNGSPDLSFFYTDRDLYRMAEAYGEAGRADYIHERFTFDLVFPLVYTAFLVSSISWLIQKAGLAGTRLKWLNLVPLLALGFDLFENSLATLVLARYPQTTPIAAHLAPLMTFLKWVSVGTSFASLLVGLAVVLARLRSPKAA